MTKYPSDLVKMIAFLKKFPGVGRKTAERFAFHLLDWPESDLKEFSEYVATFKKRLSKCSECGSLMDGVKCFFCDPKKRDPSQLCIVASVKDVYPIEQTGVFHGMYHVLGGLLSPLDGKTPEVLNLSRLNERTEKLAVKEIVVALDSTLEGDATAVYLKDEFQKKGVKVSRLALGLPLGSSLDFIDEGTLSQAFAGRQIF